jgi:hypothetical protein
MRRSLATIKPDVRMPLSSATIIICVQSTFAITPLATAITHTLTVMTATRARLTVAIPLTDAYTVMSLAMTATFVQMTRVIRIVDVSTQTSPARVRQTTNAQLRRVTLQLDAQPNRFLVLLTAATVIVAILRPVVTTLPFHVTTMTFVLLMSATLILVVNITLLTAMTTMNAQLTRVILLVVVFIQLSSVMTVTLAPSILVIT